MAMPALADQRCAKDVLKTGVVMKAFSISMCVLILATLTIAIGCKKTPSPAPTASATESLPANLIATTPPTGAVDIIAAKAAAKDGDTIVIKGRVGAQKEPLAANRAIMTLADISLPTCDKTPMDNCPTPWDSCCQPAEELVAKSISVQVVGADGRPLKAGLAGVAGIAPLKQVIVSGTAKTSGGSAPLIVLAKQIYVMP
jgi:hypothetical protein